MASTWSNWFSWLGKKPEIHAPALDEAPLPLPVPAKPGTSVPVDGQPGVLEGNHVETPNAAAGYHVAEPSGFHPEPSDARRQVSSKEASQPPYRSLCELEATWMGPLAAKMRGTGFFVDFKNGDRVILTAAHVIHDPDAGRAKSIQIFPNRTGQHFTDSLISTDFRVRQEWSDGTKEWQTSLDSSKYDFGIIFPPQQGNFSKYAALPLYCLNDNLANEWQQKKRPVWVAGWPTDEPRGTLWVSPGKIKNNDTACVACANHTSGGQSGGPLYFQDKSASYYAFGVHIKDDGMLNRARRIDAKVIQQIEFWYFEKYKKASSVIAF